MNNTIVCRIINARLCHCENIKRILLSCGIIQRPILSILYHSIGDTDRQGTNELSSMLTPRKSNNVASARWTARIVIIARPAASRRIIWQANRWKKMQPAPLSFFEQNVVRKDTRQGPIDKYSWRYDHVQSMDDWTQLYGMGVASELFPNGKGASCALSTDSWQCTESTNGYEDDHPHPRIFWPSSNRLLDFPAKKLTNDEKFYFIILFFNLIYNYA